MTSFASPSPCSGIEIDLIDMGSDIKRLFYRYGLIGIGQFTKKPWSPSKHNDAAQSD